MRSASKVVVLGLLLALIPAAAWAQGPIISPIANVTLNAGITQMVNVVAVDPNGDAITLSVSGATWATLNAPTTGNGLVVTTLTLYPLAADVGDHTITVTATANGETDTEDLLVHVTAAGSDQAPVVVAPANQTVNEGTNLTFTITASDADAQAINFLSASGLPSGATFTAGAGNTSGTFSWTPSFTQAGSYDVGFTAANGLEGQAVTHIQVNDVVQENHAPDVTA
ncbi:MAG TPA: putative Ig domain-containing protein, partial [Candidatus Eisenbacteria bacterium]|nr:putative Ig domain-containing protein [Candidatus Eisenbacteria bacterium]